MANQRWVFVVRALDKPGTLTATAVVFSNRGGVTRKHLGQRHCPHHPGRGATDFDFSGHAGKKKELLHRTLERLSIIFRVDVYPYDDDRLRAIAVAKLHQEMAIAPNDHYSVEQIAQTASGHIVMLTGPPSIVETAIAELRDQGNLQDIVMSYITV